MVRFEPGTFHSASERLNHVSHTGDGDFVDTHEMAKGDKQNKSSAHIAIYAVMRY